ncbi:arginine N-methyltransferase [Planoprotostelium fungivorum]|uniref:Arginine N-methyltransferase n=1 Tax=Planoprotostelium fungivorum TaxID=1890364 RepID=A0A2P6NPA6_9EUKA|nr:arginine N-methyltransferase [Planoprotostelium fungivorum]
MSSGWSRVYGSLQLSGPMSKTSTRKAFVEALRKTIVPNKSKVINVGSGSGILSLVAARDLKAEKCVLYEQNQFFLEMSKKFAAENNIENLVFRDKASMKVTKAAVKGDIVVSDTFAPFCFEFGLPQIMRHARQKLLDEKGQKILIPARVTQMASPVNSPNYNREITGEWSEAKEAFNLDYSYFGNSGLGTYNVLHVKPEHLADPEGQIFNKIDFENIPLEGLFYETERKFLELVWETNEKSSIYGFCTWWEADLAEGVKLSTNPKEGTDIPYPQVYLPLLKPFECEAGDSLHLNVWVTYKFDLLDLEWEVTQKRNREVIAKAASSEVRDIYQERDVPQLEEEEGEK